MTPTYDVVLVILSVVIAMLASFAALNFAAQVTTTAGSTRAGWLLGGATVMGVGIWSMHFVGMLAFHLPVTVEYGLPLMLLSVGVAIAASLLALSVVSRRAMSGRVLLTAALLMGTAIAGMHYIGMASMHAAARLTYDVPLVVVSILIAIGASVAALWLAFRFRRDTGASGALHKALAAVAMGVAIAGMHYTGMAAARFSHGTTGSASGSHVLATDELGQVIAFGTLFMLAVALVGLFVDRRVLQERVAFTGRLQAQAQLLGEQKAELEAQTEALAAQTEQLTMRTGQLESRTAELDRLNEELLRTNAQLQCALREAERARSMEHDVNVFRKRFVSMVIHELRTPVGAIGGYAQLLLMQLRGPLTEAQERDLHRIEVNQQHLLRLINEILDLAKLEAGQMPLHLSELELQEVLEAARPMIEPQLMAKSIRYERELDPEMPKVVGDPERVRQILINLLANSIKFTPAEGCISVRARQRGDTVDVCVCDSGPGIPADKVGSLFTPFLQLGTTNEPASGTGLGLTISRELARAMGGELGVEESLGGGATFVLSLHAAGHAPAPPVS